MLAGTIATAVNTALPAMADAAGLPAAHGGLLHDVAVPAMPMPSCGAIKLVFHTLIGLAMAVVYAVLMEPWLPGCPVTKGLIYAAAAWLINALVVLPLIREELWASAISAQPALSASPWRIPCSSSSWPCSMVSL